MDERYIRQEILEFLPTNFQEKIKRKKITVVGCGGVGSVLAQLLVRGGFCNLILIDNDKIDITNLHRQAFFEEDLGEFKVKALNKHLIKINSKCDITSINRKLTSKNVESIFADSDLIVDCTDSFSTRILINKFCEENKRDWIYNGAIKGEVISCIFRGIRRDFKRVFPKEVREERASDVGILPSTTFLAGALGFNQVVKYFIETEKDKNEQNRDKCENNDEYVDSKLIKINLWNNKLFELNIK